jgi:hypothetical protein
MFGEVSVLFLAVIFLVLLFGQWLFRLMRFLLPSKVKSLRFLRRLSFRGGSFVGYILISPLKFSSKVSFATLII